MLWHQRIQRRIIKFGGKELQEELGLDSYDFWEQGSMILQLVDGLQ